MAAHWRDDLLGVFGELAWQARRTAGAIGRAIDRDPIQIVGYRGYGTADRALVLGRVLQDEGVRAPDPTQSRWRNLISSLRRMESDPLPFARVRARAAFSMDKRHSPAPSCAAIWHRIGTPCRARDSRVEY